MGSVRVSGLVQVVGLGSMLAVLHGTSMAAPPDARRAFFGELHLHTSYSFDTM